MGIGASVFLIALGAILAFAVNVAVSGVDLTAIGYILMVAGAVVFAQYLGISETVIALTIIAGGTGLPEVATSVVAGLRGQRDIAIGNVVGSNIFNILAVLGVAAAASKGGAGLSVPQSMISFDLLIIAATAAVVLPGYAAKMPDPYRLGGLGGSHARVSRARQKASSCRSCRAHKDNPARIR